MLVFSAASAALCAIVGCSPLHETRGHHDPVAGPAFDVYRPNQGCELPAKTAPARAHSIETYDAYWAGYVEFDDEGWLYGRASEPFNQIDVIRQRLKSELDDPKNAEVDFLVLAFVHGWHHDANDSDCNVHEFRSMLKITNDRYAQEAKDPVHPIRERRIVGVYASWRGESLTLPWLSDGTVLDRRNAADRVARGDVRQLFAELRALQIGESRRQVADPADPTRTVNMRSDRMRTVVVGHSFGGLIAFHSLSPAILNELTLTQPRFDPHSAVGCQASVVRSVAAASPPPFHAGSSGASVATATAPRSDAASPGDERGLPPVFPDMLVLINPAFEATRFESLHNLSRPDPAHPCDDPPAPPKVIVVTADNDQWTGGFFHVARNVLTVLEGYPPEGPDDGVTSRERDANTHAIGFTERYKTHRLCFVRDPDDRVRVVAQAIPPTDGSRPNPYAPVWVAGAPKEIVNGHDGFLFADNRDTGAKREVPYLLGWLIDLHLSDPARMAADETAACWITEAGK